jgi:hypothetical protein
VGAAFGREHLPTHAELAAWFGNADMLLREVTAGEPGASPVVCWPHHFDIATLVTFDDSTADPEQARSVGLGLSPGDAGHPEPYFYIGPWPRPTGEDLPSLPGCGAWDRDGLARAAGYDVLQESGGDPSAQQAQARSFLEGGLMLSKRLLGV